MKQTMKPLLTYTETSKKRARALRRGSTNQQKKLWMFLRNKQLGMHFRRQAPIGHYIVDFLSVDSALVVELDGSQHYTDEGMVAEKQRDTYLSNRGLTVLRFSNLEVTNNIDGVLQTIEEHVRAKQ